MDNKNYVENKNAVCEDFQTVVSKVLVRHKSILDTMTKLDEYNARINRAVAKSVTSCGCISIDASKQNFDADTFEGVMKNISTHVNGEICEGCKDIIEEEIGSYLFYLASLCESLGLDLSEALTNEYNRIKTLGVFSLK